MEAKMDGLKKGMDGLKKGLEAKMDGLKNGVEAKIDDIEEKLKGNMECLKEDLTKLLQEMIPNGEKVVDETHDEKRINVNHDFVECNVGFQTLSTPNIDMSKFYGKDLVT